MATTDFSNNFDPTKPSWGHYMVLSENHFDARGLGPDFPDLGGNEALGMLLKEAFSEVSMGGWDVKDFIGMELHLSGSNVPFSPSQS